MNKCDAVLALLGLSIPLMLLRAVHPVIYWAGAILALAGMAGAFWYVPTRC